MQDPQKLNGRRGFSQQAHSRALDHQIKSLQDEIELTIYNYENILQTEKKNSSQRSQFLLYLIQSLRTRHLEQIQALSSQIQNAEAERESVQSMQKQMENIGQGLDQIMDESHKLKAQNQSLLRQLEEQQNREKQLDQEVEACQKQLDECRLKIDDWERQKIKWNRHKKQMLEMIQYASKAAVQQVGKHDNDSSNEEQKSLCIETGYERKLCEHCQKNRIEQLRLKYSPDFRKST